MILIDVVVSVGVLPTLLFITTAPFWSSLLWIIKSPLVGARLVYIVLMFMTCLTELVNLVWLLAINMTCRTFLSCSVCITLGVLVWTWLVNSSVVIGWLLILMKVTNDWLRLVCCRVWRV